MGISTCVLVTPRSPMLTEHHGEQQIGTDTTTHQIGDTRPYEHCVRVDWPGRSSFSSGMRRHSWGPAPPWVGSLLYHGKDPSGQMYRRNRFYDPQSGRFTQEDPIGIAGGLNVYGYANGDPITYGDPFGHCPKEADDGSVCLDFFISKAREMGFKGDNRGFNPNAEPSQSRVQIVASSDGTITWDHISESCGPFGCSEPAAWLPVIGNWIESTKHGDGSFTIAVNAINSAVPLGLAPAINANVTFTPDGKGGFRTSGNRDAMPSLGIYHRVNGQWRMLQERPEEGGLYLMPFMRNDSGRDAESSENNRS